MGGINGKRPDIRAESTLKRMPPPRIVGGNMKSINNETKTKKP